MHQIKSQSVSWKAKTEAQIKKQRSNTRIPNSNNCACFLLIVITFLSLLPCTFICKSQLRFVSCGVFTQLNENSDYDSE